MPTSGDSGWMDLVLTGWRHSRNIFAEQRKFGFRRFVRALSASSFCISLHSTFPVVELLSSCLRAEDSDVYF